MRLLEKTQMDNLLSMTKAHDEGLAEGLEKGKEEGLAEGAHEKALETAKNLLSMGLSIEQISKATELSAEEVKKL